MHTTELPTTPPRAEYSRFFRCIFFHSGLAALIPQNLLCILGLLKNTGFMKNLHYLLIKSTCQVDLLIIVYRYLNNSYLVLSMIKFYLFYSRKSSSFLCSLWCLCHGNRHRLHVASCQRWESYVFSLIIYYIYQLAVPCNDVCKLGFT